MATQSRGAPYPLGTDANNTAADLQALALWANDRPGVSPLTTTGINALTGVERWDGRIVLDTTIDRLKRWDAGSATWITIPDNGDIGALLATTGLPAANGTTASRGVSTSAARADHVHPATLDAIDFTSATPIVIGTNISNTGDGSRAWRRNYVVTLEIYIVANANTSTAILTMPAGWRPPYGVRAAANLSSNTTERAIYLNANGELSVEGGMSATQILYGSMTYVV